MLLSQKLTTKCLKDIFDKEFERTKDGDRVLTELRKELKDIISSSHTSKAAKTSAESLLSEKRWLKFVRSTIKGTENSSDQSSSSPSSPAAIPSGTTSTPNQMNFNAPVENATQNNYSVNNTEAPQESANQMPLPPPQPLERSPSADSFCSDSYHPNRTLTHTYENIASWADDETVEKWLIGETDILSYLRQFREGSIRLTSSQGNIHDNRILSLYSIFPFLNERNQSVTKYMPPNEHDNIKKDFLEVYGTIPMPKNKLVYWCTVLSMFDGGWFEAKDKCLEFMNEAKEDNDDDLKLSSHILFDLVPVLTREVDATENAEDSFVHRYVRHFLDNIFSTEPLFYQAWANLTLNNSSDSLKPDWTLYVKPWYTRFDLASCEVKPPSKVGRGDITDFVKMGLELKEMLEPLLEIGVEDAHVFGILVEGTTISVYGMNRKGQAYCMYQFGSYQLITKRSNLPVFPLLFSVFLHIKNLAVKMAKQVDELQRNEALGKRRNNTGDESTNSSSRDTTPILKKRRSS